VRDGDLLRSSVARCSKDAGTEAEDIAVSSEVDSMVSSAANLLEVAHLLWVLAALGQVLLGLKLLSLGILLQGILVLVFKREDLLLVILGAAILNYFTFTIHVIRGPSLLEGVSLLVVGAVEVGVSETVRSRHSVSLRVLLKLALAGVVTHAVGVQVVIAGFVRSLRSVS